MQLGLLALESEELRIPGGDEPVAPSGAFPRDSCQRHGSVCPVPVCAAKLLNPRRKHSSEAVEEASRFLPPHYSRTTAQCVLKQHIQHLHKALLRVFTDFVTSVSGNGKKMRNRASASLHAGHRVGGRRTDAGPRVCRASTTAQGAAG